MFFCDLICVHVKKKQEQLLLRSSLQHVFMNKKNQRQSVIVFFSPISFQPQKHERMPPKKRARKQSSEAIEEPPACLTGGPTEDEKTVEGSVSHLEELVSHGDADALLELAECCAFGRGTKQDVGRAGALLSEAAGKGNKEAQTLTKIIEKWKGQETVDLSRL